MRNKIIVFLSVLFLLFISYLFRVDKIIDNNIINNEKEDAVEEPIKVNILYEGNNIELNLEDYIIGVVSCEMPASFNEEALKALSVAARTFAMYKINSNKDYVMKTTISDQCYIDQDEMKNKWGRGFDKYYNKIYEAVYATHNEVMTYKDEIIISFYFAISNGYTENVENVFSQKLDYLVSVNSEWDKEYNYKEDKKEMTYDEFEKILKIDDIKESDIKISRSKTNRVNTITVKEKTYKGTEFRKLLNLKSTDFEIKFSDKITISTKGYGHGVGMSEYGANVMANQGYTYSEILKHYYNGIKIVNNY